MALRTQGTELFFINPLGSDPLIVKLHCPTGISGLGGAADQIDVSCLEDLVDKSFLSGLGNPGQVSVPFVLDPDDASHQLLFALKDSRAVVSWLVALSDGTTDATAIGSDDVIEPPSGRSSLGFMAYLADVAIDIAGNEVVRGTLTLQRSGIVTPTWKMPV